MTIPGNRSMNREEWKAMYREYKIMAKAWAEKTMENMAMSNNLWDATCGQEKYRGIIKLRVWNDQLAYRAATGSRERIYHHRLTVNLP